MVAYLGGYVLAGWEAPAIAGNRWSEASPPCKGSQPAIAFARR
jgi:hypothetical protein